MSNKAGMRNIAGSLRRLTAHRRLHMKMDTQLFCLYPPHCYVKPDKVPSFRCACNTGYHPSSSRFRFLTSTSQTMANNASRSFKTSAPARSSELPPGYAVDPAAPAILRFEASLPRLPVPTLSSTGAKYLETVRPHLTPSEFERTQSVVKSFVQSDLGKKLQERLQARAADPDVKNWLAEWWNDVAYMAYRDPVVVYVSYFYVHVDDLWRKDQVKRAAGLVKAFLPFREMVESCVYRVPFLLSLLVLTYHPGDPWNQKRSEVHLLPCHPTSGCKPTSSNNFQQP